MEKQLIEFPLKNGKSVWVETELSSKGEYGAEDVSLRSATEVAARTFEDAMETARNVAESVIEKLTELSKSPQEIDVEFSLKLNSKIGAIVSSAEAEANFKVTLKWRQGNV